MAVVDAYTNAAAMADYIHTSLELMAYYSLRPELYFDAVADVRGTNLSQPGNPVQWNIAQDLAPATTPLDEQTDVPAVALTNSTVIVTMHEYGNAVLTTALARGQTFVDLDDLVTNAVGFNAGISIDTLVANMMDASTTNTLVAGGNGLTDRTDATIADTLGAADIRRAVAKLRGMNAPTWNGMYLAFIHPDVQFDLQGQTGTNTWSDPHAYSDPTAIWNGEIGAFQGARFIATPRAPITAGGGEDGSDVYSTIFLGRQAVAKAFSQTDGNTEFPTIVPGPITDKLRRQVPIGWYWLGGYGQFRTETLFTTFSASTI